MSRSKVLVSLVAIPLLVLLVACGGDKKESSSSNDGGGSDTSSSSNSSGGGSNNSNTSSNDGAVSPENCKSYAAMEAAATKAFGGTGSTFKIDEKALNDLAKNSPSEIRSDMTLVVGTIVEVFQSMEKLGVNFNDPSSFARMDAAKLAEFEKIGAKFDDKKFVDASERIDKYFVSKCS